ncbi:Phage terminase, large subunit [Escherichia coli]|nr:Phage terminase, large subunit [Escherichia coli]
MIPVWSTACPDWAERLKKGLSIIPAPIYPDRLHMHWRFLNNCDCGCTG